MTVELSQALWVILIVSVFCVVWSPVLCWILPNRTPHMSEETLPEVGKA